MIVDVPVEVDVPDLVEVGDFLVINDEGEEQDLAS